jgi:hypothetical protein
MRVLRETGQTREALEAELDRPELLNVLALHYWAVATGRVMETPDELTLAELRLFVGQLATRAPEWVSMSHRAVAHLYILLKGRAPARAPLAGAAVLVAQDGIDKLAGDILRRTGASPELLDPLAGLLASHAPLPGDETVLRGALRALEFSPDGPSRDDDDGDGPPW